MAQQEKPSTRPAGKRVKKAPAPEAVSPRPNGKDHSATEKQSRAPKQNSAELIQPIDPTLHVVATAKDYARRGWSPIPLHHREKEPVGSWSKIKADVDNVENFFSPGANIGVKLGLPSDGLVDIDLDWPEARTIGMTLLSMLPAFGRPNAPAGHRLAVCPEILDPARSKAEGRVDGLIQMKLPSALSGSPQLPGEHALCVAELRGSGCYTMFPGSVHPNGEVISWETSLGIPDIPEATWSDLNKRVGLIAFLAVCVRFYPGKGHRDETCMALSGALVSAAYEAGDVDRLVELVARLAHDEEHGKRQKAARTAKRSAEDKPTTGLPKLVELLGLPRDVLGCFRQWLQCGPDLLLHPEDPLRSARAFVDHGYLSGDLTTLLRHNGEFLAYEDGRYIVKEDETLEAELYPFLERAHYMSEGVPVPYRPKRAKVSNVVHALQATVHVPSEKLQPPTWLKERDLAPDELVVCQNGILHLPTGTLHPPTPEFFTRNALQFAYDAKAPKPKAWLAFMKQLWPNEPDQVETLQDWFGYCLVPDTVMQKALLLIGPKRGGKGTIARVLQKLVGDVNRAAPTMASLGENFGLEPLLGKQLAVISDARLDAKANVSVLAERILSITGEDTLTVNRKYKSAWTGKLSARFMILTNLLPTLTDSSGALASRFLVSRLTRSFYGKEDLGLAARLLEELPGILNWAIEGWRRLRERGYFKQPVGSRRLIEQFEEITSPITGFIREKCVAETNARVLTRDLYLEYRNWSEARGVGWFPTQTVFGRDLSAAEPTVERKYLWYQLTTADGKPMIGSDGKPKRERDYFYTGVRLRTATDPEREGDNTPEQGTDVQELDQYAPWRGQGGRTSP